MNRFSFPNIRSMFVPDRGMEYFDIDLDSADLRIVVWESNCVEMKAMFAAGLKPYVEVAKEYYHDPSITKHHKSYAAFKSLCHGCVTAGHEVLTPQGWIAVEDYEDGTPIMTCSLGGKAWFEIPSNFLRDLATDFHTVVGESSDFEFTQEHRMPFTTTSKENLSVRAVSSIPNSARIPCTTMYDGPSLPPTEEYVRLLAAFQADGTEDRYGNITFHLKKERKLERLRKLLRNYKHSETVGWNGAVKFYIPWAEADFASFGKSAGAYLLNWRGEALDAYLDELQHWDGWASENVQCHVSSIDYSHCSWIQTVARLRGKGSQVSLRRAAEGNRKDLFRVSLNSRNFINLASTERKDFVTVPRAIYCPTVSTGLFLLKKGDHIVVSGNTNYLGKAAGVAPRVGLLVHEVERIQKWYFGKFPQIKQWQDDNIRRINEDRFITNVWGYRLSFFDRISEQSFREGIAWIPQSTVGILINHAYVNIDRNLPEVQVLLQVHDSLAGQYPYARAVEHRAAILREAAVPLPYAEPLIIPVGIKTSTRSWGDCG